MQNLSETIKISAKSRGITQKWLAEQTGITMQRLSDIFNGKTRVKGDELILLCFALEIDMNTLLPNKTDISA